MWYLLNDVSDYVVSLKWAEVVFTAINKIQPTAAD